MCLKFQLTSTSTRPTVAIAMCWAVRPHLGCEHACGNVCFCKLLGLGIKLKRFDVCFGHGGKSPADRGRCRRQLLHREAGQDENTFTSDEAFHKPDGVLRELFVLAAAHDRGVCVDPDLHGRMLSEVAISILHRDSRRVLPCCPTWRLPARGY